MSKTWMRFLSLAIALVMVLALAACGTSKTDPGATTAKSTEAQTTTAAVTETEKAKEPITLKFYGRPVSGGAVPGIQTDPVAKEIEKILGITIDYMDVQEGDETKFKAMLASGDLPDVLCTKKKFVDTLVKGNNVIELDKLIETNGPNVKKLPPLAFNFSKKFLSGGTDKLYFLAAQVVDPVADLVVAPFVRWDYYQEMGSPDIKNDDELLNLIAEMKKKHPTNEQGQKYYGMSPWFDWGLWGHTTPAYRYGIYNRDLMDYDMVTLELSSIVLNEQSSYWQTTKFYNKANQMGLLDPDSLTQKYDNALQKAEAGRVLFSMVGWPVDKANKDFVAKGEALKGYMPIPPLEGTTAFWGGYEEPLGGDAYMCITTNCQAPERAMDLIDFTFSPEGNRLLVNGVKGVHWDEKDGKAFLLPETITAKNSDPDFVAKTGITKHGLTNMAGWAKAPNGQRIDLFNEPDVINARLTELEKAWASYYGVKTKYELMEKRVKVAMFNTAYFLAIPETPDDIKRIDDKVKNYLTVEGARLILAKTDADYDAQKKKMIEALKGMDLQKSVDYWTKTLKDAIEVVNGMMK